MPSTDSGSLAGHRLIVTGGASGLGHAMVEMALARGARVAVIDRASHGVSADAAAFAADVTDLAALGDAMARAVDALGGLDAAINAAGITGPAFVPLVQLEEADFDAVMGVNVKGVWAAMRAEIPALQAGGSGGAIVNIASVAGLIGSRMGAAYTASKHAVVGLSRAAALEYGRDDIRVNALCPGWVETPMTAPIMSERPWLGEKLAAAYAPGRLATPDEVAEAALWLASPASGFVTGAALPVDGGLTAG